LDGVLTLITDSGGNFNLGAVLKLHSALGEGSVCNKNHWVLFTMMAI